MTIAAQSVGLTSAAAETRLAIDGFNELPSPDHRGVFLIIWVVAREASAIVLLDDDFSSIVTTIRLGRRIYDNLRKAIEYIVAVHIPIAGLALLPLLLGLPLMLAPIHIAFLEMIIDPACSTVFEAETEEEDVMRRPPRDPASPLLLPKRPRWPSVNSAFSMIQIRATVGVYVGHQIQNPMPPKHTLPSLHGYVVAGFDSD